MCWEQLPVGEWADCVLIVCLAIADDPGLGKMLSILSLVLKKKTRSGWLNQLLLKVGEGGVGTISGLDWTGLDWTHLQTIVYKKLKI